MGRGCLLAIGKNNMKSYENILANSIYKEGKDVDFGEGRELKPIINIEDVERINGENLGMDYRAKIDSSEGYGSVFEGLAFDKKVVRSQSFSIEEFGKPVAVMTVVIAPKIWIEQQRYFEKLESGVKLVDASAVVKSEMPDFFVIPAWTKVAESHRNKLAMPGVRTFKNILNKIEEESPEKTYIEAIAQGQVNLKNDDKLRELFEKHPLESTISFDEFPFDENLLCKNNEGSASTVKIARLFGFEEAENICSANTLGPVYYKNLK